MEIDALIVGGGLAGLSAAYEICSRGYSAVIVDEAWKLGGQLRQQTQVIDTLPSPFGKLRGFELATAMIEKLQQLPIQYLLQHEVIGFYNDGSIGVSSGQKMKKITPKSVVIATGAAENAFPFPGWTLPGVMTIGAAQILINREWVYPGKTGIIIGSSDMALEIAVELKALGITILGVVEEFEQIQAVDREIISSFERSGIPLFLQTNITSAAGHEKVQKLFLQSNTKSAAPYDVDFICTDHGRCPITELCSIMKCRLVYQKELGGVVPYYGTSFQTSVKGVFAAGQTAGITCHGGVLLTGALAGLGAVDYLSGSSISVEKSKKLYWDQLQHIESGIPNVFPARMRHIETYRGTI